MLKCIFNTLVAFLLIPCIALPAHTPTLSFTEAITTEDHQDVLSSVWNGAFHFDDILDLLEDIENGDLEKRSDDVGHDHVNLILIFLAQYGVLSHEENVALEKSIVELKERGEYLFSFDYNHDYQLEPIYSGQEIVLCKTWWHKRWDHTKKFAKKHKKEILIGAAVVAAAAVTAGIIAAAAPAAAKAAAAVAGGAAAGLSSSDSNHHGNNSSPQLSETEDVAPDLPVVVEDQISVIKGMMIEDQLSKPSDHSLTAKDVGETIRHIGSKCAHQVLARLESDLSILQPLTDLVGQTPGLAYPVAALDIALHGKESSFLTTNQDGSLELNLAPNSRNEFEAGHQQIDRIFNTDLAHLHTPEALADQYIPIQIGELPLPAGGASKAATVKKANHLKDPASLSSHKRFTRAEKLLEPYQGKYLPETQIKELIQKAGITTFSRPKGIPENFRVKLSDKVGGIKYVHPLHTHESIRVMPGKPHSPNQYQQKPYVVHMKDGKALDKLGNRVDPVSPEAHIPLDEFIYREK